MSVPLDRLYYFLKTSVNDDVVIYHWYPHGSKKLQDLVHLGPVDLIRAWNLPQVIFHDQEPFDPDFWSECELQKAIGEVWHDTWGYPYEPDLFAWMTHRKLNALISPNIYDKSILVHSNHGAVYADHTYEYCYYWCHALLARDWFRFAQHDRLPPRAQSNVAKPFLCYNRSWTGTREYRVKFAEMLVQQELLEPCKTWFSASEDGLHYSQHAYQNPNFRPENHELHRYFQPSDSLASASADYVRDHYVDSAWEVVLETVFDSDHQFLTEKVLRPIACTQPFILAASPGSLQLLHHYGFKTFGEYIDESYDTETDPVARLKAVLDCMRSALSVSARDYQQVYRIAQYNHARFFSDQFLQVIVDEYQSNMKTALEKLYLTRNHARLRFPAWIKPIWDHMVNKYPILRDLDKSIDDKGQWL